VPLRAVLDRGIEDADAAIVDHVPLLRAFGCSEDRLQAGELWRAVCERVVPQSDPWRASVDAILSGGPLARRILRATGPAPDVARIHDVYRELADCLVQARLFNA
jgi:carboxylate-amine ligase